MNWQEICHTWELCYTWWGKQNLVTFLRAKLFFPLDRWHSAWKIALTISIFALTSDNLSDGSFPNTDTSLCIAKSGSAFGINKLSRWFSANWYKTCLLPHWPTGIFIMKECGQRNSPATCEHSTVCLPRSTVTNTRGDECYTRYSLEGTVGLWIVPLCKPDRSSWITPQKAVCNIAIETNISIWNAPDIFFVNYCVYFRCG